MRVGMWALALSLGLATAAAAEDEPKPEEWKRMYQDASAQLRAAQDRKAEMAAENAKLAAQNVKLAARAAELEKQAQAAAAQADVLRRDVDGFAQRTFCLRAFYSAWESFGRWDPAAVAAWRAFVGHTIPVFPDETPAFRDPLWPVSAKS